MDEEWLKSRSNYNPNATRRRKFIPLIDRFNKGYEIDEITGCWNWCREVHKVHGYGYFAFDYQKVRAHKWSYEFHKGPVPSGLVLDHLCRNKKCVNPDHLEAVTQKENIRRGLRGILKGSIENDSA